MIRALFVIGLALLLADRVIAGLVAASYGVTS